MGAVFLTLLYTELFLTCCTHKSKGRSVPLSYFIKERTDYRDPETINVGEWTDCRNEMNVVMINIENAVVY